MPAKKNRIHNESATYVCLLTNLTELKLTNIQANYRVRGRMGQMHCGLPNQNFGWALTQATQPGSRTPHILNIQCWNLTKHKRGQIVYTSL